MFRLPTTCTLWQNDCGLLRATAVTREVERTPNMSHYKKLTLEKKIPPPLLPEFEFATFPVRVQRSTKGAIPTVYYSYNIYC